MSAPNANWERWIFASAGKHFDARKSTLALFIEGQHRDGFDDKKDFAELRVDGPYFVQQSKGYWRCFTEINILVQSTMGDVNWHKIHTDTGIITAAFTEISVYKYGDGAQDDDSLLGCMTLVDDAIRGRERIQVSHFGQVATATKLMQATVEGHYEMFLNE